MDEQISGDNSTAVVADNPSGHAAQIQETSQTNGQPMGQSGHVDELFKGVDVNKLPPELRIQHDNMVRSYREKTEKLSETIKSETEKAIQAYKQKSDFYDQIANQEEFVKQWNDYVQKAQQQTPDPQGDPVLSEMKAQLQEMNQKIQVSEMAQITEAFAEAVDEKGALVHPDFDQLNSFSIGSLQNGNESEEFSLLRACVEIAKGNSPQERLANGYKAAKSLRDAIFEEGKKAGMGRLQAKALNGTQPPSLSSGDVLSVTEKKPKNAREAMEMAKKGIMVSRE